MSAMLLTGWYLLKVVACSAILTGYYWLMLRNKLYHQYNRFFLMASVVLSLTLPLLTIHIPRYVEAPQPSAIPLLQTVELEAPLPVDTVATMPSGNGFEWRWLPIVGYALVSLVMLVLFIRVLWYIRSLIYKYKGQIVERFFFVNTTEKNTPFSFFNYIFWNEGIDLESPAGRQIFRHEVAHVQERHSHDKLFMNLLLIVFWSNPFFWLIRKELGMIHEFIADKRAVEDNDTASFAAMILQAAYPQHRFDMVNPFFYSPIKRRLLMLTKKQSPQVSYLSRILVLPLAVLVFAAFTFKAKTIYAMPSPALTDVAPLFTVVLDAGHGGADAGAYGPQGEREKDLALAIVQQVQRLNPSPNIRYVLSRPSDVQLLPIDRVQFCKDQQADLFISLHLDAAQQDTKAPSGLRVLVGKAGAAHGAASKLLAASLIQHFQRNYGLTVSPYPIQPTQGVMVLDRNHCPSVLIEAGFMSNPQDVAYLKTEAAQKAIAQNIMAAVNNYRLSQVPTVAPSKGQTATIDTLPTPKTTAPAKALATDGAVNDLDSVGDYRISASENAPPSRLAAGRPVNGLSVGTATFQGVTAPTYPLIVVNGQVVGNTQAALAQIDVNIIREINVLKAASGVKQYGDQARHGVIEVITKEAPPTAPVLVSGTKQKPMAEVPVQVIPEVVAIGYKNPQTAKNTSTAIVSTEPADVVVKGYRKTNAVNTQQENQVAENATDKFDGTAINTGPNGGMPGGQGAWAKHLQQKLNTSIAVKEGWAKGVYKVLIQFVTDEAGHISDVKALNYQDTKMAQHCIDIVKSGPQWEPAVQGGRKVKTYRQQPITFVIE